MIPEYDVLDITDTDQIITPEELETAEPETVAEEAPAEPETEPEEVAEPDVPDDTNESEAEAAEPEDELVGILTGMRDTITSLAARLDAMENRIAESEAREAARGKKLSGFFAPVTDGVSPDPDTDPLPRIDKKYIY